MRWPVELFAFSLSLGFSMVLASSCGTPGLGVSPGLGSGNSSGTGFGGHKGTGGTGGGSAGGSNAGGGSSSGFTFDSGLPDAALGACVPLTCSGLDATCGPQGDGCGGLIQCGNCPAGQTCGGGGKANTCGGTICTPQTCAGLNVDCGPAGDGCGGLLSCGSCTSPQTCGGGSVADAGVPGVCGGNAGCQPTGCAAQNTGCGPVGDGCGGIVQCGTCAAPETCGGGGVPGQCGVTVVDAGDGGNPCTPRTCAEQNITCGFAGDGCGNQLQCGSCTSPQYCGAVTAGQCGGNNGCTALTCAQQNIACGPAGDGCGNELQCGTCTAPQTCGGGTPGTPGQCGGSMACVPTTCAALGFNCGPAGDGCGGLLSCGTSCPGAEICGGGGLPGVCGPTDAGALGCTGLCLQQTTCAATNVTTTISGTVYAPNGTDPLYDALVYVPNGGPAPNYGVTAFSAGVHCGQCGSEVSGSPLVSTTTAPDGTFQLQNVPVGANIPLVIQLGRWRSMISIPSVASCTNTALTAAQTALPSQQGLPNALNNIPLMAFATGQVDSLECVLLKIGINQNQFSNPAAQGGNGRIRFYLGEGAAGAQISAATPKATQLWGSAADIDGGTPDIDQYDMVYFPCQGAPYAKTAAEQAIVINYANAGGRVFGTHYSYVWYDNDVPFSGTATWDVEQAQPTPDPQTGYINTSFARGQALAQWLQITGASTTYAQMSVSTLRHDFNNVVAPSLLWVSLGAAPPATFTFPMHYTFDTPVGSPAATQCGRALFDDFHVENANNNTGVVFPAECPAATVPMTAQEKMLEFMIFDLSSCIIPTVPVTPTCTPLTCAGQNITCGPAGDGCGNQLACGTCTTPETCGGGGVPGQCGGTACTIDTCAAQGIQCGPAGNGCGGVQQCGVCPNGQTCGGGNPGVPGQCGKPSCTALTCASQGIQCGPAGNGCGGLLSCGHLPRRRALRLRHPRQVRLGRRRLVLAPHLRRAEHLLRPRRRRLRRPARLRQLPGPGDLRRRRHARHLRRPHLHADHLRRAGHRLRPRRRRLRWPAPVRRLPAQRDLRRRRRARHVRHHLRAHHLHRARLQVRPRGRRLRWAAAMRHLHLAGHLRRRRRAGHLRDSRDQLATSGRGRPHLRRTTARCQGAAAG